MKLTISEFAVSYVLLVLLINDFLLQVILLPEQEMCCLKNTQHRRMRGF